MKYNFPAGLYTDVRIEHVFLTNITYTFRNLDECKEKKYSAAFVRVFDGERWYHSSTSDLNNIQDKINQLAAFTKKNANTAENPLYPLFSDNKDTVMVFENKKVSEVTLDEKITLLQEFMPKLEENKYIKLWSIRYVDEYKVKEFYSSKGAEVKFDYQRCGFRCGFQMAEGERIFREAYSVGKSSFNELNVFEMLPMLVKRINECEKYLLNSIPVESGNYTVILAPIITGIFTHECFGHKSESDFMLGDETAKAEWALGKKVGSDDLSIIECGDIKSVGYTPYDDEGIKAGCNYLVKNGILAGRLHNVSSAVDLGENTTGNGRAINYEYEPIVRMTTTYIDAGKQTEEELFAGVENGIYIKDAFHGSGMSTFTIAPSLAYYIRNGKIAEPVRVSVVSGNVFEALGKITGISDKLEITSFVTGGCGKMEQYPLPVGFGGPYIRVDNMNVQ